jgi:hypothetical protein
LPKLWKRLRHPLADNPLRTRADVQRAARDLFDPLLPHWSEGGARVKLGSHGVWFSDACEELEGFARPLWGLVPLALGGGRFDHWDLYRRGLENGSDPTHPEFWGWAETDQRMVEMAAVGFALAFLPDVVWEPLAPPARDRLVAWLDRINQHAPHANNWQFFRVLVNLGLARVGRPFDGRAQRESLDVLEGHWLGDGWYRDGELDHVDYYVAWAYHVYGLLYAASGLGEPARAARFRERARRFAADFQHWFDPRGAAVPFGRSLTYRFAQGAFWGALVFADEEALPWGRIKGLYLRHLREWATHAIADRDGVLSVGYGYANLFASEPYNSAGSPYWAMKFFLALAAPEAHPFWRAEEEPLPALAAAVCQPRAGMVLSRDATQTVALSAGQADTPWPNGPHKYGKFAYSSLFGPSVGVHETAPHHGVHDSMLALRQDDGAWRVRAASELRRIEDGLVYARWRPWPDVVVETALAGATPWHLRLHRITTPRALHSLEAGFALAWDGHEPGGAGWRDVGGAGAPLARTPYGESGIRDLAPGGGASASRRGLVWIALPNTNLVAPRTVVPVLAGRLEPGRHVLACAVLATDRVGAERWEAVPLRLEPLSACLERNAACAQGDA